MESIYIYKMKSVSNNKEREGIKRAVLNSCDSGLMYQDTPIHFYWIR